MNVDEVLHSGQRSALFVPRSKGDVVGNGRVGYLSDQTTKLLGDWMKGAGIECGPLFRGVRGSSVGKTTLETSTIRRLVKRAARRAGIDTSITSRLSGHSMRVGAAQDMMVAGIDSLAIMQSGGWKTPHVVLRYVEHASTRQLHERRWERIQRGGLGPYCGE